MTETSSFTHICKCPVKVVEIVGLPGTGKTTIANRLVKKCGNVKLLESPSTDHLQYAPFFIKNLLSIASYIYFLLRHGDHSISRREIAWLSILKGWPALIHNLDKKKECLTLLEQGSIYFITALDIFGSSYLHHKQMDNYWNLIYKQWAETLDICLFIDAKNECLQKRIENREKSHLLKGKDSETVGNYLNMWRNGYLQVIKKLQSINPKIKVIEFDNEKMDIEEALTRIQEVFLSF